MNHDDLENWASRVVEELQDFCNEAQEAAGNPDGEDCLPGTRALIAELDCIFNNRPVWQTQIAALDLDSPVSLVLDAIELRKNA